MQIAIGCDHGGFALKEACKGFLVKSGHSVVDFGCYDGQPVDYPTVAIAVAEGVADGRFARGVVICTTGIGVSIAANKVPGVRCALCVNTLQARLTRMHNDSNVLALGAQVTEAGEAEQILALWLDTSFSGVDRHARRIGEITAYEQRAASKRDGGEDPCRR